MRVLENVDQEKTAVYEVGYTEIRSVTLVEK